MLSITEISFESSFPFQTLESYILVSLFSSLPLNPPHYYWSYLSKTYLTGNILLEIIKFPFPAYGIKPKLGLGPSIRALFNLVQHNPLYCPFPFSNNPYLTPSLKPTMHLILAFKMDSVVMLMKWKNHASLPVSLSS